MYTYTEEHDVVSLAASTQLAIRDEYVVPDSPGRDYIRNQDWVLLVECGFKQLPFGTLYSTSPASDGWVYQAEMQGESGPPKWWRHHPDPLDKTPREYVGYMEREEFRSLFMEK